MGLCCADCKNVGLVRGLKKIDCEGCGETRIVNGAYNGGICPECSVRHNKCIVCGKGLSLITNTFSDRVKIVHDYEQWLLENKGVCDCGLSVITYLEIRGLLKNINGEGHNAPTSVELKELISQAVIQDDIII